MSHLNAETGSSIESLFTRNANGADTAEKPPGTFIDDCERELTIFIEEEAARTHVSTPAKIPKAAGGLAVNQAQVPKPGEPTLF